MQISQYISELLFRYDCVVVPGFGAFLSERVSAKIDKSSGEFFPPCKRISFNTQLKSNDGLLANHISSVEEITYENAISKIKKQVDYAIKSLENKIPVEFANIGSLTKSNGGKIIFDPIKNKNYLTESFGLSKFICFHVNKKDKENTSPKLIKFYNIKIDSNIVKKYAAAIILFFGLSGIIGSHIYNDYIEKHNSISQEKADSLIENHIQEATFVISKKLPVLEINLKNNIGDFHVVAGAFRIKKNSEKKLRELKRLGFKARIIGKNRFGLYQVVFGSYYTKKKADLELVKIRKSQDKSAWILQKEIL